VKVAEVVVCVLVCHATFSALGRSESIIRAYRASTAAPSVDVDRTVKGVFEVPVVGVTCTLVRVGFLAPMVLSVRD